MNYLEIIKNVVNNGTPKQATRYDAEGNIIPVENGTIGTFCEIFRHDMSQGFPLTTLRKMPWRSIRVELEGFIKGITDKKWYQDRKCGFWNEWSSPMDVQNILGQELPLDLCPKYLQEKYPGQKFVKIETQKQAQEFGVDLGPVYGYQWRNFGKNYTYDNWGHPNCFSGTEDLIAYPDIDKMDGVVKGFDQLKSIVDKLHTSPYDRRMVCSAWNPNQMHMMALPSCHVLWNVVVYGDKLNLVWHQRSCDLLLGVGANIASYALLLELLAKEAGLIPGELVGTLADCHIYENHMDAARELITRSEKSLPELLLVSIGTPQPKPFSIFDWTWDEAVLTGYDPHDKIDVGAVTI